MSSLIRHLRNLASDCLISYLHMVDSDFRSRKYLCLPRFSQNLFPSRQYSISVPEKSSLPKLFIVSVHSFLLVGYIFGQDSMVKYELNRSCRFPWLHRFILYLSYDIMHRPLRLLSDRVEWQAPVVFEEDMSIS